MSLNIFYQNARGLRTKTKQFYRNILNSDYDIICISETWLLPGIYDAELFDSRYNVYRNDRDYDNLTVKMGGGTMIAVRRGINVSMQGLRKLPFMYDADVTCVNILLNLAPMTSMLRLFCCYFPQNDLQAAAELSFYEYLSDLKIDYPNDKFLLVGDFNIRVAKWVSNPHSSESNLYLENPHDNILTSQLFAFLCFNDWSQYNHVNNMNDRQLDLVISDLKCIVQRVAPLSLPEDGHHPSLYIDVIIDYTSSLCPATRIVRRFHAANYDEINRELSNID